MSFRLKEGDGTIAAGVRRIARAQIEAAIAEVDDGALDRAHVVHQVRKRCKKIRSLLRLVRPKLGVYRQENKRFRDAARLLSTARDAEILVATYDQLAQHFGRRFDADAFAPVRARLVAARNGAADAGGDVNDALAGFRAAMAQALDATDAWKISGNGGDAMRAGLEASFEDGRKALKAAHRKPDIDNMHTLRKRVKDAWYQTRLLRDIWPGPMRARAEALGTLADLLGEEHDLAVFAERIDALIEDGIDSEVGTPLRVLATERRRQLQGTALALADRVYAGRADAEARRMVDLWKAWRRAPDVVAPAADEEAAADAPPAPPKHTEIERKFVVRGDDWREAVERTSEIRQGYLCNTHQVSLRVRIVDGRKATMTAKSAQPTLTRTEIEFPVPRDAAEALLVLVEGHVARKHRHTLSLGQQTIVIDEYLGPDSGIVVAEIEMADAATAPPSARWLGQEVTGDARYYAANIAAARR